MEQIHSTGMEAVFQLLERRGFRRLGRGIPVRVGKAPEHAFQTHALAQGQHLFRVDPGGEAEEGHLIAETVPHFRLHLFQIGSGTGESQRLHSV